MKITGVGPKIAVPTFLYIIAAIIIDRIYFPFFSMKTQLTTLMIIIGILLLVVALICIVPCAVKLKRTFGKGVLMQDGLFKVFRNPIYSSYLIFVIPALAILFNSWLVLSAVILNFVLLEVLARKEYDYLKETFGDEYKEYLKKVWFKFL